MNNTFYRYFICIILGTISTGAFAQRANSLYFLDNNIYRQNFNPAFQPLYNGYFGFGISNIFIQGGNNSFALSDIIKPSGKTLDFTFNDPTEKDRLYNKIRNNTNVNAGFSLNVLAFGFRRRDSFWNFDINVRSDAGVNLPKSLFEFGFYLLPKNSELDFSKLHGSGQLYSEIGIGYSRKINDKLTVGAKLKYILGAMNTQLYLDDAKIINRGAYVDEQGSIHKGQISLGIQGKMRSTLPGIKIKPGEKITNMFQGVGVTFSDLTSPSGMGAGIDLGAVYKPIKNLTLSLAVLDLGAISWYNNSTVSEVGGTYYFEGIDYDVNTGKSNFDELTEALNNAFIVRKSESSSYLTRLNTEVNLGIEYGFLHDRMSVGLLSNSKFYKAMLYQEFTGAMNFKVCKLFSAAATYSMMNGNWSSMGAALVFNPWIGNFFISVDYIPFHLTKQYVPYNIKTTNIQIGFNIALGRHKVFNKTKGYPLYEKSKKDKTLDINAMPMLPGHESQGPATNNTDVLSI